MLRTAGNTDPPDQSALMAKAQALLAENAIGTGDIARAKRLAELANQQFIRTDDLDIHMKVQLTLGRVYCAFGEDSKAVNAYFEMLRTAVDGNRSFDISRALLELGPIYERHEQLRNAACCYIAAEGCLTHRPSPRYSNAREELLRFQYLFGGADSSGVIHDLRHIPWQELADELLSQPTDFPHTEHH